MTTKAMILAAGLGNRMRPLTDNTPKPLLKAGGKPLIQYHLERLAAAGVRDVVINLAYLGDKIRDFVGNGSQFGLSVQFSAEPEPLETGGAIAHAQPLLGSAPFLLVNGDVWSDYDFSQLLNHNLEHQVLAHLVMVQNPPFHPNGDFALNQTGRLTNEADIRKFTFSGISLIDPELIQRYPEKRKKFALGEVFRAGITQGLVSGEYYDGNWSDVGTPERLADLDNYLSKNSNR